MKKLTSSPGHSPEPAPIVDRRGFLRTAGALGAGYLALGASPGLWRLTDGAPAIIRSRTNRPINMLCLGDSIMWGQGLAEGQKFRTLVEQYLRASNGARRPVRQLNFAHSGATIGDGYSIVSNRVSRATLARVAARQSGRAMIDDSELDAEIGPRRDSTQVADNTPTRVRRTETSWGDALGGEIPRTYPTLWRQMDLATGRVPSKMGRFEPDEVDLILMDGGANDVGFFETVVGEASNEHVHQKVTKAMSGMAGFLPEVLDTWPNAKVVVTGYYPGITRATSAGSLKPLVDWMATWVRGLFPLPAIVGGAIAEEAYRNLLGRAATFEASGSEALRAAVEAKGRGRAIFVSPEFGVENGYGALQSYVFEFGQVDPASSARAAECDRLLGNNARALSDNAAAPTVVDTAIAWTTCRWGSLIHPNPAGARRYAQMINARLPELVPELLARPAGGPVAGGPPAARDSVPRTPAVQPGPKGKAPVRPVKP